ncbi:MAG: SpoIID/LytB domain-containing protein [Candidatus Acidiferrum sp.]
MKKWHIVLSWCVLAPGAAYSQGVRVRLYTTRPPAALTLRATEGEIRWRVCATCAMKSGHVLSLGTDNHRDGAEWFVSGHYELRPGNGPIFSGDFPAKIEEREGHLLVTVTMPLEEYVAAVLMAESGDFKYAESQKAMAVVARTYAMRFIGQHAKDGFDFCDTTHCQVIGWKGTSAAVRAAANATRGEVLRYDGKLAQTFYHQNCGGTIAAAKEAWPAVTEAYLVSHRDPYCAAGGGLQWESAIRITDLNRALRASGLTIPAGWNTIEIASRSESGRVQRLKLQGGAGGEAPISGSTFRFAVDRELGWNKIRSDLYEVRNTTDEIVFSGRGAGHGVGLCQAGAEEMARQGKSYAEILNFYYPGTQLGPQSAEDSQWQKRGGEHVELLSTQPEVDSAILPVAERILKEDEQAIGWDANAGIQLRIYATMDAYRNTTGEPGWVAASTRGRTIRLQPLKQLEKRSIVESTLRHEIFHVLVEEKAKAGTPLWFREGIVLFLAARDAELARPAAMTDEQIEAVLRQPRNQDEVRRAYAAAESRVAKLVRERGKETVLGWLGDGIPNDVRGNSGSNGAATYD